MGQGPIRQFIAHLFNVFHSQWLFQNLTVYHKMRGYLAMKKQVDLLTEIAELARQALEDFPAESRFLLELDFDLLVVGDFKKQA